MMGRVSKRMLGTISPDYILVSDMNNNVYWYL